MLDSLATIERIERKIDRWIPVQPAPTIQEKPNPDAVDWIQSNFYIPELNGPIKLLPYQIAVLREASKKDADGNFLYSIVVWGDIKKSAKSSITAAMALYRASQVEWGSVKIIANDLKQADSRVAYYLRRAITMNPMLKDIKQNSYKTILPNHTTIEAIPIDPGGEAGGNDDFIVFSELWAARHKAMEQMWCYDDQTEILTKRGWIFGTELSIGDEVATVTPIHHKFEWEKITNLYCSHYQGDMHLYKSRRFSECVTPNHRLYGIFSYNEKSNKYAKRGVMRSDELRKSGYSVYFPLTNIIGYSGYTPDDVVIPATKFKPSYKLRSLDWFEYLGWYLAEGRIKHNGDRPCSVYICQSPTAKPEHWEALVNLHNRMFGEDGWRLGNSDTDFIVDSSELAKLVKSLVGSGTQNKFVSQELKEADSVYLQLLFWTYLLGDGHWPKYKSQSIQAPCGSQKLVDDLCEIGFKLGYSVTIRKQKPYKEGWNVYWRLNFTPYKDGYEREVASRHGHWQTKDYNGLVWCPSTKNGLLVVRRDGKIYVSGNTEMTISPTKFGKSQRWIETYAGFSGESPILERVYERGIKGQRLDLSYTDENGFNDLSTLEVYAAGGLLMLWNTVPRCPWQTANYYAEEEATLLPTEFRRVHKNEWVGSTSKFVEKVWWQNCYEPLPALTSQEMCILATDAAKGGESTQPADTFAVTLVTRHPHRSDAVAVRYCGIWQAEKGKLLDYEPIEQEIIRLITTFSIIEWPYDPYQLHDMAQRLKRLYAVNAKEFQQTAARLKADKQLRDMIISRRIAHDGNPSLSEHIDNANVVNHGDEGIRLVKRQQSLKIDAAVALSMAVSRVLYYNQI